MSKYDQELVKAESHFHFNSFFLVLKEEKEKKRVESIDKL